MSSVSKSRPARAKADPFRYGWRYVRVKGPDGTVTEEQVPLTEEDVLFPKFGDFIVQNNPHDDDVSYLKAVSKSRLARDRTSAVLSDCRVDFNLPGVRPLGPDVAAFTGVARDEGWQTFRVRAEGARPLLVVEVTSPATEKNDLGRKVDFYYRAEVPVYVIVKASGRGRKRRLELIGYRHAPGSYERIESDEQGRIYLDALQVWLGTKRDPRGGYDRVVCYDGRTGEEIGDLAAQMKGRARADRRAEAESRRAEAESRRRGGGPRPRRRRGPCGGRVAACGGRGPRLRRSREPGGGRGPRRAEAERRIRELEAALKRPGGRKS